MLYFLCLIVVLLLNCLHLVLVDSRKVTAKIDVSKCLSLLFGKLNTCIFLFSIMSRLLQPTGMPLYKVILRETQKSKYR